MPVNVFREQKKWILGIFCLDLELIHAHYICAINVINIFSFETCIYMTTMNIIRATQLVSLTYICAGTCICMHAGSLQEHVTYNYLLIYPTLHIFRKKNLGGGGGTSNIYS